MHADWAGKLKSAEEFAERRKAEAADLAAHSGPADWDRFGGWEKGPTLKATGFFRAEKLKGKWWLVDPDGKLFWSHGIDSASAWQGDTPITDRRHYFKWLPDAAAPEGRFYRKDSWAPLGYYKGRQYETYTFFGANLARKYGADWNRAFTDVTHARLRSWGMNTIGNWSHADIYMARKTPYTVPIYFRPRPIAASEGYWRKFPDPFDPTFAADLRGVLAAEKGKSAGDPWCIGYFVDNELSWGDGAALAVATLASPPEQSAKRAFLEALRKKYQEIEKLNAAWGTQHASWEALSQSRTPPERGRARADLDEFATRIAEQYFRTVRDAVKEIAPNNLYLGCRFGWMDYPAPAVAVRAAASFCDVISFNVYQTSVAGFRLPEGLDAPVIIGEFQFGALDRGLFHPGLQPVADQQERAARYRSYIEGALRNAQIVGAHWFEYGDQAATGRGDGENCQFGFVDVTDTPYRETIQACRDVGYRLYTTAWGNK
jgi:hypothetical protein